MSGTLWLPTFFYQINRGYGKTKLTADRMQFCSFVSRRRVPWNEITRIEKHSHQTRGGTWWDIRVHRAAGRPLRVPGAFTFGSSAAGLGTLEQKLKVIREYRANAVIPQAKLQFRDTPPAWGTPKR